MAHLTKLESVWCCFRAAISAKYFNRESSRTVNVSEVALRFFLAAFWSHDCEERVRLDIAFLRPDPKKSLQIM
jgi:hypothetical protein